MLVAVLSLLRPLVRFVGRKAYGYQDLATYSSVRGPILTKIPFTCPGHTGARGAIVGVPLAMSPQVLAL